jgi:serine/threonine protein kinase
LADVIGGGGFGQVWRAKWKGTPVAVKVLTGTAQAENVSKAVLEEFIAEINMVSGMRHPNICLFMGACLDPPNRAIVTELCENGSLWDALRSPLSIYQMADGMTRQAWPLDLYDERQVFDNIIPPLTPLGAWPWALVKRVAAGTARGMCYLHSGDPPVLHRDLKSANILLDESYTAKLADFGLSRLKAVRSGMTGNCGTVQWMAPEVLCSEHYAEPADVYSFGIILWEMLTQECPYEGLTPIQCALSVLNQNMRPVVPDWCPQPFSDLINGCVDRDPQSRPTFTSILAALDD